MRGDSILALLHHHFTVQCRLMSGTWDRLSVPGYAERAVWARSTAPDGLPLAGEDKQGVEPSVRWERWRQDWALVQVDVHDWLALLVDSPTLDRTEWGKDPGLELGFDPVLDRI
jgi:hypothetical protein